MNSGDPIRSRISLIRATLALASTVIALAANGIEDQAASLAAATDGTNSAWVPSASAACGDSYQSSKGLTVGNCRPGRAKREPGPIVRSVYSDSWVPDCSLREQSGTTNRFMLDTSLPKTDIGQRLGSVFVPKSVAAQLDDSSKFLLRGI